MTQSDRFATVEAGRVTNIAVWDGEAPWEPQGEAVACPAEVGIGWRSADGRFEPPETGPET